MNNMVHFESNATQINSSQAVFSSQNRQDLGARHRHHLPQFSDFSFIAIWIITRIIIIIVVQLIIIIAMLMIMLLNSCGFTCIKFLCTSH